MKTFILILFLTLTGSCFSQSKHDKINSGEFVNIEYLNSLIVDIVNRKRILYGKKKLSYSKIMQAHAKKHNDIQMKEDRIYHPKTHHYPEIVLYNRTESGKTYIALAKEIVKQYMDSDMHRKILLSDKYTIYGSYTDYKEVRSNLKVRNTINFN
jgi:uncharacterized protein YkwD